MNIVFAFEQLTNLIEERGWDLASAECFVRREYKLNEKDWVAVLEMYDAN